MHVNGVGEVQGAPDTLTTRIGVQATAEDVTAAVAAGALRVGDDVGVPLHHYPLEETAAAHDAVEAGAVGKVLVDVTDSAEVTGG